MGRDLTQEECRPTLPEQGQQSRSGDGDQGQPRVQRLPDKSAGMRQIRGQARKSGRGWGYRGARAGTGIPAGWLGQGPRTWDEASPAALCLDPDGRAQAALCQCWLWAWTAKRLGLGAPEVVCLGPNSQDGCVVSR